MAGTEGFNNFQALDSTGALLAFGFAVAFLFGQLGDLSLQVGGELFKIQFLQQVLDSFGTHLGDEGAFAALGFDFTIARVIDQLQALQAGFFAVTGIKHDEVGEIQNLFQVAGGDIQQHAHPAGNSLEIPDVADRSGQLNMTHTFPANLGAGDLHAALITDLVLVLELDPLVFTAVTLPVLGGSEDAFAVQTVPFGLQRAVVNGFGFGNFTVRPGKDLLRRSHTDLNGVKIRKFEQKGHTPFD